MKRRIMSLLKRVPKPDVVDLTDVELLTEGEHPAIIGPGKFSRDTLQALVDGEEIYGPAPLKIGHWDKRFQVKHDGDAAYGWVQNLHLTERDGSMRLYGDYVGVPTKLAGLLVTEVDDDGNTVRKAAYPHRSVEVLWDMPLPTDPEATHPAMLRAVAILGATKGADSGLADVTDVFYEEEDEDAELTAAAAKDGKLTTLLATVNLDDIRKAWLEAHPETVGDPSTYSYVREVWLDTDGTGGFLIVEDEGTSDELERVPWTISAEGAVEFGQSEQVRVQYTAAASADPKSLLAARLDAKPGSGTVSPTKPETSAEEALVDRAKLIALLKEKGVTISDDATDEQVLEAFGKLQAAEQTPPAPDPPPDPAPAPDPAPNPNPAEPQGLTGDALAKAIQDGNVVVLSKDVHEDTLARLKRLEDEAKVEKAQDDEELLETAMGDGRILPAEKAHYASLLASDQHDVAVTLLSALQPNKYPVDERGNDNNPTDINEQVERQLWPEDYTTEEAN